jgi:murein DD-endopeptidase MepM/ murein hydrolase activator NlpD
VYAADSGIVTAEGSDEGGYGNIIRVDHGNGYLTVYAHLSVIEVPMCQSVDAGQQLGAAGSTGNATGAHLHFEFIHDGLYINPWDVLP